MLLIPHADAATLTIPPAITEEIALLASQESWLGQLEQCENKDWPVQRRIVDTNGFYSYGPLMFQMGTWLNYGASFGATRENIYDKQLQETVATSMLNHGGIGNWWTCGKKVTNDIGAWPSG